MKDKKGTPMPAWDRACALLRVLAAFFAVLCLPYMASAVTKTANTTGNWSDAAIWSPAGVPKDTDNVIIAGNKTITINGNYTCHDLDFGNNTNGNTNLKIITAGNSLTITGDLDFNASNKGYTYILDAGPGTINVNGTFSHWSTSGTNKFQIGTGTLNFTPAVNIDDSGNWIVFTGAGTVRFSSAFTDEENNLTTYTGCVVNFYSSYTVSSTNADWNTFGTANFYGTGTITANKNILINNINVMANASLTLAAANGTFTTEGNLVLGASSTFNMNDDFTLLGNLTNNGGSISADTVTLIMNGPAPVIGGTTGLTLYNLQIGAINGTTDVNCSVTKPLAVTNLSISKAGRNRTLALGNGVALTVTGDLSIDQPTKNNYNATLSVGSGTCSVAGNLSFIGSNNGTTRIAKIDVTGGSFTLAGGINWMTNNAVATEVITVTTGSLNFNSSVTMGNKSGTIKATSTGTINFNGTSAPSLNFSGATAPVLSTASGCTVNFAKGLTAGSALTFAAGSTAIFTGTATITPTAAITFGHVQFNANTTLTAAGNLAVKGDWTNYGTFTPGTYTVTFNGTGIQALTRTGGETFYNLSVPAFGTTLRLMNDVMVTNTLTMGGANIDLNTRTLTLGNNAAATLSYSIGQAYGGTFKRWFPATAITSNSGSYHGLFPVGTISEYRPVTINSTSNPSTAGYVMVSHTDGFGVITVNYTDNGGSNIQKIADKHSDISTSGLAGGTYTLAIKFTDMGSQGSVSNLKLLTYTNSVMGSYGTHVTTLGPLSAPTGSRSGLTMDQLSNAWVIGTNDRNATPLYNYVYSRKTGNWNDASSNGTWSYTRNGDGCSCVPTSSGYATIAAGHTVTVTATDTVKFLDVDSAARITVNSTRTFNVQGSLTMYGTGNFTNNGTLKVANELLLSSATSPIVNGNVTVTSYFTLPSGAAYTQSSGTLTVSGELSLSGNMHIASGASLVFDGNGGRLSGTGNYTTASGGTFPVSSNKIIEPGTLITIGTPSVNTTLTIASGTTVNNLGSITVNGNITGSASSSTWINNANSSLSVTGALLATGTLDVSTSPNTVNYSGSGAQTIKVPYSSYYNLTSANSGTKTMGGNIVVDNALTLGGSVVLDESTNILSGNADLVMSGTAELKLQRATDDDLYPELNGTYNCTGGTVTINQTGDSCVVHPGQYYNLKLNGSTPYDISGVSAITNNLDVQSSATLNSNSVVTIGGSFNYATSGTSYLTDSMAVNGIAITAGNLNDGDQSINVFGANGWTRNTGGTFTPLTGTVYFTGADAQTLGGTATGQTFNGLCINKTANTVTVGGSTTSLTLNGDMTLITGTFDKGTAATINMAAGNWNSNGGTFTAGTGTVTFTSTALDQAIQGTAASANFNNLTVAKSGYTLAVGGSVTTLNINGNVTLTSGIVEAGTATAINMTAGNWTNNGATFTPDLSTVTFSGTGAQAINGTAATQTFHSLTTNKSNTLSVGGSTTTLTLTGNKTISAGTFNTGTATAINVAGNWNMTAGTFTNTGSTVTMNGTTVQDMASTGAFNNLTINNALSYINLSGNITVSNTLAFTNGIIQTNASKVSIGSSATVSGAGAGKYIYGNEEIAIPNSAAPSRTFHIGDAADYTPVTVAFSGTTSGSGSLTAYTTTGDASDITNSGINSAKSVNRTWTLTNNGIGGFTSYAPTFTFVAGDIDGGASTSGFVIRKLLSGVWATTTTGTLTATTSQATGATTFGAFQIGEPGTVTVSSHPANTSACDGAAASFTVASASTPAPSVKWQRDPDNGTFEDITALTDAGVYSNYTSTTLHISDVWGLTGYRYRAVLTNINGSATSNNATLTVIAIPGITAIAPASRCGTGTVSLGATASAGTVNWYAASSGGSSLGSGTSFVTPSISSSTNYFAEATYNGCVSASRAVVTATVSSVPSITGTTPGSRCSTGTVDLGATASAGTISWFAAPAGGSSVGYGTSFTTPSISTTTTYYAEVTDGGCTSASRTGVTATVNGLPTATISYSSCPGVNGVTTVGIAGSSGAAPYTYSLNNGDYHNYDTLHIANGSNQNYYVKDANNCVSSPVNFTTPSAVPTHIATAGLSSTCSCSSNGEGRDMYLMDGNALIAIINDKGHNLGVVTATVFTRNDPVVIINNYGLEENALQRSFLLDFTGANLTPNVEVTFPFTNNELNDLIQASAETFTTADDIYSVYDLGSTQYEGPAEDDTYDASDATMIEFHNQVEAGDMLGGKYIKVNLSANGEHWLHGNGTGSPLPIKLVSFDATNSDAAVEAKWVTSLEINNDYFTVERSNDGVNFTGIGTIAGKGNSTTMQQYNFTDVNPLNGISYYRLRQTDYDGKTTVSNVVPVSRATAGSVKIYPNPAAGQWNVTLTDMQSETTVTVYDLSGKQVYRQIIDMGSGIQTTAINTAGLLPAGAYMVSVTSANINYNEKLIIK